MPLSNVSAHCDEINSEGALLNFKVHIFWEGQMFFENLHQIYLTLSMYLVLIFFQIFVAFLNCIREIARHIYHIIVDHPIIL